MSKSINRNKKNIKNTYDNQECPKTTLLDFINALNPLINLNEITKK